MTENFETIVTECKKYLKLFLDGDGMYIPPPSEDLQAVIRKISIKDFEHNFKSDFNYKELDDIKHLTVKNQINKVKENADMDDATIVSVVLSVARFHLTGKYTSQINFLLAIIANKPDREELIWKTASKV